MTKQEELALRAYWNRKLKESGFQDIEKWDSFISKRKQKVQFIRSHIRWDRYKTKQKFLEQSTDLQSYFRVLGIYAHHGPIKPKYKEIIIKYSELGFLSKALRALGSKISPIVVQRYLNTNKLKMLHFVNEMDSRDDQSE